MFINYKRLCCRPIDNNIKNNNYQKNSLVIKKRNEVKLKSNAKSRLLIFLNIF